MKKILFSMLIMLTASVASASTEGNEANEAPSTTKVTITTDENGNIASVSSTDKNWDDSAWHIRDLSGATNIRNKPNGKICMKLKAHTQYEIYSKGQADGWLVISSIYNLTQGYWVRLHSSSTGNYWIAKSILY